MINLTLTKSEVGDNYFDFSVGVDTGTTGVSVNYGICHKNDIEDVLNTLQADLEKLMRKLGMTPDTPF
jgi:hypothetical protein